MSLVQAEVADGVATLVLNRPQARNALNPALLDALAEAVAAADRDPAVGAIVVTGGGGHFSAGADMKARWPGTIAEMLAGGAGPRDCLAAAAKPVIAAVHGAAIGGGLELALSADLMLVADDARLALPEYGFGTLPVSGVLARLAWACSPARAAELLFSSRTFGAEEAVRLGLAVAAHPAPVLLNEAQALARRAAAHGPALAIMAKQALKAGAPTPSLAHEALLAFAAFEARPK